MTMPPDERPSDEDTHAEDVWAEEGGMRLSVQHSKGTVRVRIYSTDLAVDVRATVADYRWRRIIEPAILAAERRAKEAAAHLAEQFGSHILHIYARGPGDPPGNQYVPLTGRHVADAIRRSISPGGE